MRTECNQRDIINPLITESREFNTFYLRNKAIIDKLKIRWYEEPSLLNGYCRPFRDGTYEIVLKKIPPSKKDAFIVAHEMEHCILWELGYPKLIQKMGSTDKTCSTIIRAFNSMAYDWYVNKKLKTDFSDICSHFFAIFDHFFNEHLKGKEDIGDKLELEMLFLYVNFRLTLDLCDGTLIQKNDFLAWFEKFRSDIVDKAIELISTMKKTEFDDKTQVKDLFNEIVKTYRLNSILIV
jgi:hypothetical protein